MRIADTHADQEARVDPVVEAGGGAGEVVGQRGSVAVAQHAAQPTQRTGPGAQRSRAIASRDLTGLRQRLALTGARSAARVGHLLAQGIHEHHGVVGVHGAEVGPGLAADRIQRRQALLQVEVGQHRHHLGEVILRRATDRVQRFADINLVAGLAAGVGEGRPHRQEDIVRVVYEKRCHEGEVGVGVVGKGESRVGAGDAARGREDAVGLGGHAGDGMHVHRAAVDGGVAGDVYEVALGTDLDLVGRARVLGVVAVDLEGTNDGLELPGAIVPLTMVVPTMPLPLSTPPLFTVVRLDDAIEPFTASSPALIVVPPV